MMKPTHFLSKYEFDQKLVWMRSRGSKGGSLRGRASDGKGGTIQMHHSDAVEACRHDEPIHFPSKYEFD